MAEGYPDATPADQDDNSEVDLFQVADAALEKAKGQGAIDRTRYSTRESLQEALVGADVVLLKSEYLLSIAETKGTAIPKRQDLPGGAFWTVEEQPWTQDIVSMSYCWAKPDHPDPTGEQLRTYVAPMLDKLVNADGLHKPARSSYENTAEVFPTGLAEHALNSSGIAVFIDWSSLFQNERSEQQQASFNRALKNINLWYAHYYTHVWMVTKVPEGCVGYDDRGWPNFERAISDILTSATMLLDLGQDGWFDKGFHSLSAEYYPQCNDSAVNRCKAGRTPPPHPSDFAQMISTKKFTNGADRGFVVGKYAETYFQVFACAKSLKFSHLYWNQHQFAVLCHSFEYCGDVELLDLSANEIESIPVGAFQNLANCKSLNLTANQRLTDLKAGTFDGMQNLEDLMLPSKVKLQPGCFRNLAKVKKLTFHHFDALQDFEADTFNGLSGVTKLTFEYCPIGDLKVGVFNGLHSLLKCDFSDCKITSLQAGSFRGMPKLKKLYLFRSLALSTLEANVFDGLPDLEELYLSANSSVEALRVGCFSGVPKLKELSLGSLGITTLEVGVFEGLADVMRLDLSSCSIAALEAEVFEPVKECKDLMLGNMKISTGEASAKLKAELSEKYPNLRISGLNS